MSPLHLRRRGTGAAAPATPAGYYTLGGGGSSSGSSLLTQLEIGGLVLLGLGAVFLLAEIGRPVIDDIAAIRRLEGSRG